MPTIVHSGGDISVPDAARTNGHADRGIQRQCSGFPHDVFAADRSAVSVGVSLLRSGAALVTP